MTAKEILQEIKPLGRESYKKMLFNNYGVKEPCFGVKIGDLKKREAHQERLSTRIGKKSVPPKEKRRARRIQLSSSAQRFP